MSLRRPIYIHATDTLRGKISNAARTFGAPIMAGRYRSSLATDALVCQFLLQTESACWMDNADPAICAPKSSLRLTLSMILLVD